MRFDALAGYCRQPEALFAAEELGWYSHGRERLLAALIRDRTDNDYGGIILAKDGLGRYRWVDGTKFESRIEDAEAQIRRLLAKTNKEADQRFHQGDEKGSPLDFFTPVAPQARLASDFRALASRRGYAPARGILKPMMHWYEDVDGNFVQQFQTSAFDARMWELYLFATFHEMGYAIDRIHAVPDFRCIGLFGSFTVEAVTVNPTRDKKGAVVAPPPSSTPEEQWAYLREYMPIKFAGPLTAKLDKKYWEKPGAQGQPFLLAIADFHSAGSMTMTRSALPVYLYGYDHKWAHTADGRLEITPVKVAEHRWGTKVVASGFFDLPNAEHVSAVIFSNSGTISKFNRMGLLAGFGPPSVRLIRRGFAVDPDPNASAPRPFAVEVEPGSYNESWAEGLDVFHNPRALHPVNPVMFPGAAHHRLLPNGQMDSLTPNWHPLSSHTYIFVKRNRRASRKKKAGRRVRS